MGADSPKGALHVYVYNRHGEPPQAFAAATREVALTALMNHLCKTLTEREVAELGEEWLPENYDEIYRGLEERYSNNITYNLVAPITEPAAPMTRAFPEEEPVQPRYSPNDEPSSCSQKVYADNLASGTWAFCSTCVEAMVSRRGAQLSTRLRLSIQRRMTYTSARALKSHKRTGGHLMLEWQAQHAEYAVVRYEEKEWLLGLHPDLTLVIAPDSYGPNWGVHRETVTDLLVDKLRALWMKKRPKDPQPDGWEDLIKVLPKRWQWLSARLFQALPVNLV